MLSIVILSIRLRHPGDESGFGFGVSDAIFGVLPKCSMRRINPAAGQVSRCTRSASNISGQWGSSKAMATFSFTTRAIFCSSVSKGALFTPSNRSGYFACRCTIPAQYTAAPGVLTEAGQAEDGDTIFQGPLGLSFPAGADKI